MQYVVCVGGAFKNVRITDGTQSQIKCLITEDPRQFVSHRTPKGGGNSTSEARQVTLFYPFNVVAPASHWLINETQEGSSGTKECQPKSFDPLTFIHCAPAKIPLRVIHVCMF